MKNVQLRNVLILTCLLAFVAYFLIFFGVIRIGKRSLRKSFISFDCGCLRETITTSADDYDVGNLIKFNNFRRYEKKKLAVIVPMRGCFEELLQFVPHMTKFLNEQKIPHHIFVVQQVNWIRFNKPTMQNVGFLYSKSKFDYIVLHDVDLLPLNPNISYEFPITGAFHVSPDYYYPEKKYGAFFGGAVILSNNVFEAVDGMCIHYWGWGLEDDELKKNLNNLRIKIDKPRHLGSNQNNTFLSTHKSGRGRDKHKCKNQTSLYLNRTPKSGLPYTKYDIKSVQELEIDGAKFTLINVYVPCDMSVTPWCNCHA